MLVSSSRVVVGPRTHVTLSGTNHKKKTLFYDAPLSEVTVVPDIETDGHSDGSKIKYVSVFSPLKMPSMF